MTYHAHSGNSAGIWEALSEHLRRVSDRASEYAACFNAGDEAYVAGLLHDLGKYGDLFQRRLEGKERGIDHWSAGAWHALRAYKRVGFALALAVQGHHVGLQKADKDSLRTLEPAGLASAHPQQLRLSEPDTELLISRMRADGFTLPEIESSIAEWGRKDAAGVMLDIRMLFSALVDADYLETEAHFEADSDGTRAYRPQPPSLEPGRALKFLRTHLADVAKRTTAADSVTKMRADLLSSCEEAACAEQGVFTLSAPTGAGKTLSMLAFALGHAARHGLRRVIMVIPYLTITEQTARIYRDIFSPHFGNNYVVEHHSLAGTRARKDEAQDRTTSDVDNEEESLRVARLMAENWDAPIVVTTSVQFLESLFANRPSACRKLHNLAQSVVLFDEVQTLPARLAAPTLATLARLSRRYGTTVVFATATQPAFSHLHQEVCALGGDGWRPREIVAPSLNLFGRSRRTRVSWPEPDGHTPWAEIASQLAGEENRQALCVVNLKRHARQLANMLKESNVRGLFHLSTDMCPAHREKVLSDVRMQLDKKGPCRLVSTQCVEAGVDVDFPVVYRAWGPLEAIAQAAGRCNRNGKRRVGEVRVFLPEDAAYPPGGYEQAADITAMLLKKHGPDQMDITAPSLFREYYESLYDLAGIAAMKHGKAKELAEAIRRRDFVEAARLYRIVDQDAINILVPYDMDAYRSLANEVRQSRLTARWIRKARPYSISVFRPKRDAVINSYLEPVPLTWKEKSDNWFIYLEEGHYDRDLLGLVPPQDFDGII